MQFNTLIFPGLKPIDSSNNYLAVNIPVKRSSGTDEQHLSLPNHHYLLAAVGKDRRWSTRMFRAASMRTWPYLRRPC